MVEEGDDLLALEVAVIVEIGVIIAAFRVLFVVEYLFYDG